MLTAHEIIKAIIRTEKSNVELEPKGQYLFLINKAANKIQVKQAVQELYKVKVTAVNVFIAPGKNKRVRHQIGRTPDTKKAIVTLKKGDKIDIT